MLPQPFVLLEDPHEEEANETLACEDYAGNDHWTVDRKMQKNPSNYGLIMMSIDRS
jgi:hypothetical protein